MDQISTSQGILGSHEIVLASHLPTNIDMKGIGFNPRSEDMCFSNESGVYIMEKLPFGTTEKITHFDLRRHPWGYSF